MKDIVQSLEEDDGSSGTPLLRSAADEIRKLRDLVVLCSDGARPFGATDGQWTLIQSLKQQAEKKGAL